MRNETRTIYASPVSKSTWRAVFVVELAVISIMNGLTMITLARNRHLRERTTCLIINLTIADFLVGTVSGPLYIYHIMIFPPVSGFSWRKFIVVFLKNLLSVCSLFNLALLPLERLHATLFPYRHCLMLVRFYFKAIFCIWFLAVIPASAAAVFFLITPTSSQYLWSSIIISVLFTVIVSYVIIALNMKRKVFPYSSGAASSERKLTVTLLVVVVLSTLAFLPHFFYYVLKISTRFRSLSAEGRFDIKQLFIFLLYANSFINPLVYTLRMKEFRKATRVWCGLVNTVSRSQIIEMNM